MISMLRGRFHFHTRPVGPFVATVLLLASGSSAVHAATTAKWTADTALPSLSATTGAQAVSDPMGGSLLFYVLNDIPTIAPVAANGTVGPSGSVPGVTGLLGSGTPGKIAFLPTGGAIVTWTLTTYGSAFMAYRSPTGQWGKPVELTSGLSNLAVCRGHVLTSEASGTGISTESWTLSPTGTLTGSAPVNVYTGQPLFNQSWVALDPGGTAVLVVLGSSDNGNTESVSEVTRAATGKWSAQASLSGTGVYVQAAIFATAPGGAAIVSWVTGQTAFAANSYTAIRAPGHAFSVAAATGSVSSSNGAYILATAASGADGTLAVAISDKVYTTPYVYTLSTSLRIVKPHGSTLSGPVGAPSSGLPETLGAGDGEVIIGTVVAVYGAGDASYSSSYTESQKVVVDVVSLSSTVSTHVLGASSGLYDGNGSQGCNCPQSPPVASVTGDALDPSGNGVAVGQLAPGAVLQSARYVVPPPPSAPRGLKSTPGNAMVTLSWAAPASGGGSAAVTGYDVYKATKSGGEGIKPVNSSPLAAGATKYAVKALRNGTKYYFTVRAINAAGLGAASSESSATPRTVSGAPAALKAISGKGKVMLAWSAPTSDGGSVITGYDIYNGTKSGAEGSKAINSTAIPSSHRSFTVISLKKGTKYYFIVKAINVAGIGAASNQASATPS